MRIAFYPINKAADVESGANLLEVLLANEFKVRSVCRGRGICATCQVKVRSNPGNLSPATPQEKKTLSLIVGADANTRLACQSRVTGDGVTVELPQGLYVESLQELLDLIGDEAVSDYLHPITGAVMIARSKVITRSQLQLFKTLTDEVSRVAEEPRTRPHEGTDMTRPAIIADTDDSPDKPSVKTLQMIWKEGPDWKTTELLRRPNGGVELNTSIQSVNGLQPYEHNYYTTEQFYRHDATRGVLKNVYGQRCMRVSEDFMIAMLGALDDEVGQAASTEIMYKCGYQWGLEDMKSFCRRSQAEYEVELEKMRVGFLLEQWWWPLTITGWGTWRYDFRQKEKGLLYVELYESAVAKSVGDIGAAVCYFYAGMFAAVFSVLSRRNLASVEMQCYSMGEDYCRFVISDYDKVDAAGFWRAQGATSKDIMKKLSVM